MLAGLCWLALSVLNLIIRLLGTELGLLAGGFEFARAPFRAAIMFFKEKHVCYFKRSNPKKTLCELGYFLYA